MNQNECITLNVSLGERSYSVYIGNSCRKEISNILPVNVKKIAIVTQKNIESDISEILQLTSACEIRTFYIETGEEEKSLTTIESLCRAWSEWGMTRSDLIIAVGGGMVTDVGGFAASVFLRGVSVIYVSTSLLGQIDAAIGGKTGVNLQEGKNLVGSFWQPKAVFCDLELLATLPEAEWRSGYGELVKYSLLGVDSLEGLDLLDQIIKSIAYKISIVVNDERESGRRAILNYGHTLAHAIETIGHYGLRHGEAVAVGLIFAAELAFRMQRIDRERVEQHYKAVQFYGLPTSLPIGISIEELIVVMTRDKKALDGLTFVLDGEQGVEVVANISESLVLEVLQQFQNRSAVTG